MKKYSKSNSLFKRASACIPGGVNSPVRAFKAVGGNPVFIDHANGAYLFSVDGKKYIDLINSWGPMILGHAPDFVVSAVKKASKNSFSFGTPCQLEVQMAELICASVPCIEKVRMVNSGTEACMSAIRLARAYTHRDKIIKFDGCYHGHADSFLIAAGSGAATNGNPDSPGVTQNTARDTLIARYNHLGDVSALIDRFKNEIAAIIVEPVVGNMGVLLPEKGFLEGLRILCTKNNIVLIFDEVMTGFRLSPGGAQELFKIIPDLCTLGKIIGGGMPVGAYGGKKEIMSMISPEGQVYQAGTLSGNPVTLTAGIVTLNYLFTHKNIYTELNRITEKIVQGFRKSYKTANIPVQINQIGSMFSLFFTDTNVNDADSARKSDITLFKRYFHFMLENGVYLPPSNFESCFISTTITDSLADDIIEINKKAIDYLKKTENLQLKTC